MTEAFIHKGLWWLPESPDKRIPGIIEYDPQKGVSLDVIEPLLLLNDHRNAVPIINGWISEADEDVTLWDCLLVSWGDFPPRNGLYKVQFTFLGHHFSSPPEIKFLTLSAPYENLNEWVNPHPFLTKDSIESLSISHNKPVRIESRLGEATVKITDNIASQSRIHRIAFEHTARLQVTYDYPVDFLQISRDLDHMSDLVVLGVGSPIARYELLGRVSANGGKVTIIDRHRHATRKLQERDIHFSDMLFCLPDLGDHADQIIKRWYECRRTLDAVIPLYFSVIDAPSMYIETQFELLARTVEAYHWKLNPRRIVLRQRINDVLMAVAEVYPSEMSRLIPDTEKFIDSVVKTRNALVHPKSPKREEKLVTIDDYLQYTRQLKAIVIMCLLKELNIPSILGSKIIEKYEAYKLAVGDYWA